MKLTHVKLAVIAYALFSTALAVADSVVVSDDTWVEGDAVTTVFGDNAAVIAKNNGSSNVNVRFPFFRFDLSNYSQAFGNDEGLNLAIISANQGSVPTPPQKYAGAVANGPATFVVELWGLNQSLSWSETTLTWNLANSTLVNLGTGYTGQAGRGFNPAQASLLATCSVPANSTPFAWFCSSEELTGFMNDRLGENNVTLMFRRTDTNSQANWGAASKEYFNVDNGIEAGDFAPTFGPQGVFGDGSGPAPTGTYQGGNPQIDDVSDASSVSDNIVEASINGRVADTGGDNPERFCRFREQGSDTWIIRSVGVGSAGNFACTVSGLKPETTYETQTYLTNAGGTVYETVETLTTPAATLGLPVLSSIPVDSGSNAGGNLVELIGDRFVIGDTQVTFGGVAASTVNVFSATKLFAVAPPSSARSSVQVDVLVTTAGGTSSSLPYTYVLDTEITAPGSPTNVSAISGDGQASLSWLAPANNGGSSITGYVVTGTPSGSCQVSASETECTISGLTNGQAYSFSVVASNSVGDSSPSAPASATPIRLLSAGSMSIPSVNDQVYSGTAIEPSVSILDGATELVLGTDYSIVFSNNINVGTATVSITGVGAYSGSVQRTFAITPKPLTDGTITVEAIADQTFTGSAITPTVVVKDGATALVEDTDYTLSFSANTNVGTATATVTGKGNYGQSKQATFKIVADTPASPTNLMATPGDAQVALSWTAPTDTGGSDITGYTVTGVPQDDSGNKACSTSGATECVVTGLTNDVEYTFSVIATNAGGNSAPSASVKATSVAVIPPLPVSANQRWALWLLAFLILSLAWLGQSGWRPLRRH